MKRNFCFVMLLTIALLLGVGTVYAQSSGSFSYGYTGTTHCVLNNNGTGIISGAQCLQGHGPSCTSPADCISIVGTTCVIPQGATSGQCLAGPDNDQGCAGSIQAGIKTNSGSGNVFLIRPSAVIGLLTDVTVQKSSTIDIGTSSALAGVDFRVAVQSVANPDAYVHVIPDYAITYASRFVQISTNLFNVLGTLCTDVTGTNTFGVTTAVGCFISFNESTVSAHSFDWIAGAPDPARNGSGTLASGYYNITVNWDSSLGNFGISRSMTCVGPVNLTVQQNKVFSFNTPNSF